MGVKLGVQSRFTDYGGVDSIAYVDDDHQIGIWSEAISLLVKAGTYIKKCTKKVDLTEPPAQVTLSEKISGELLMTGAYPRCNTRTNIPR
jgi:hypothetical protein